MSVPGTAGSRPSRLGRYELITRIGEGGMAEVQLALQRGPAGFEKLVVVKLVHENLATQKDFVDMLLDEARVAALVKHPNVVDIYDLGQSEGRFFIAMEYLEGEPLLAVLRAGREGKRLDILSTGRLIADTAEGLDAAHELRSMAGEPLELVHHDVSLGNIVVLYNGQVKLVDFGVAKATQTVSTTRRVQGKFSYMAPEKLRGGAGDRRSDIWSLGCVLWEALTLKRLFKGGNDTDTMRQVLESDIPRPSAINGDVLPAFDDIVMRALAREPADRYQTAKDVAGDLEEVLRANGYGGKNDLIAKHMQATFAAHIEARKRLLQEVSSAGRASADVVEAAFEGAPLHTGEFSVRFRNARPTSELLHAEGTPSNTAGGLALAHPAIGSSVVAPMPRPSLTPGATAGAAGSVSLAYPRASATDLPQSMQPEELPAPASAVSARPATYSAARPGERRRILLGGAVGAALAVLLVLIVRSCAGDPAPAAPAPTAPTAPGALPYATPVDAGTGRLVLPDADPGAAALTAVGAAEPVPIEFPPDTARRAPKADAAGLHKAGAQAFILGDTRSALTLFKRAQAANPGYPHTYRGLGMVYERLGDRDAARGAYRRYLQLAPSAADAASIKAKLETP